MTRRRPSLKRILTRQYVLLACLPLLMVVGLWSLVAVPQALRDIDVTNQHVATLVRAQVELLLAVPRAAVVRAAARVAAQASGGDRHAVLAAALEEAPSLELVAVLDERGVVDSAEVRNGIGVRSRDWEGLDMSRRPFYPAARVAGVPTWSDTFLSPLTGHTTALVAAPAGDRLVVADLSLDDFARQIRLPDRLGDVAVIVFDGQGRVIVHPQQQLAHWQENLSRVPIVRAALAGHSGHGEIRLDGRAWLATVAPAAATGWFVLVAQPRDASFAPVERLAGVVGVAVAGVLVFVVAIALRLAGRQAQRYRRLASAAADLVDERPGAHAEVDLGSEEVQALWMQLRRLLDRTKEQERAARRAQAELQALLDAATEVAIIAVDAGRVIRQFNRGAEKMLGYAARELVGIASPLRLHDAAEVDARAKVLSQELARPVAAEEAVTLVAARCGCEVRDWTMLRRDGSRVAVALAVTAVAPLRGEADADGEDACGFLYVATDQSERLRSAELELARGRAEAASQAKSEFLSRVSHELRTPMNAMLGYAQLLQMDEDHPLDEHQRDRVGRIEAAGWHLVTLINDVLDLSTIESGNARIRMAEIDLGMAITESACLVAPQAEAAGIMVTISLPAVQGLQPWRVLADPTRLRQVLVNIVGNAVKYNRAGGRVDIEVRAGSDAAAVEVIVADTGRGMSEAQLARLFSAFDRLGLEAGAIEGTGIGLVISRRLAERMGGSIAIDSRPGVGTRVTLTLRRVDGSPQVPLAASMPAAPPPPTPAPALLPAWGQVVYVEDNPVNALLMQEVIARRPDCELHVAVSVSEGIAMIERLRPALVLVDLHLPDGSGLDVVHWMRGPGGQAWTPVVAVSADSTPAQREAATAAGVGAYLAKPIRLAEALQLLDELLPRAA